jgi:TrmH family RNA methyltransferase
MSGISSPGNARIKAIRALRSRKSRDETGLFWIEGLKAVGEAVEMDAPVQTLVVAHDLVKGQFALDLLDEVRDRHVDLLEVTPAVFESLAGREHPQGIGGVVHQRWTALDAIDFAAGLCWVALDRVADPGNLGTIMRTADAVGAAGLILLGDTTDPHDPAAARAAMGALFNLRLVRASNVEFLAWLPSASVHLVGSSDRGAVHYRNASYPRPRILLMGSERHGLPDDLLHACETVVRLPMLGRSDSLNLAVATGILLYEILAHEVAE